MSDVLKVIGLMSGTSLDGIDAALLETDGEAVARRGAAITLPYDAATRRMLRQALAYARGTVRGAPAPNSITEAERISTEAHAHAVAMLLEKAHLRAADVAVIGYHGQTILHRPEQHWSWQIGHGALLAQLAGIDVVNDFRGADMKAGGEGAPLVPLYHAALVKQARAFKLPTAVVNIGGIANVTYIADEIILAFDTGPGNAPIDDWVHDHTGKPMDEGGALARAGQADEAALAVMLQHPFFARTPPKSLDRSDFRTDAVAHLNATDGAATLTAFTAAAIARACVYFPEPATVWIVCGGGRHNPALMAELRARLDAPVHSAENVGWRGDFVEAEAFAYLAVRSVKGLPLTLPTTTGVGEPMTGGKLHRAR